MGTKKEQRTAGCKGCTHRSKDIGLCQRYKPDWFGMCLAYEGPASAETQKAFN